MSSHKPSPSPSLYNPFLDAIFNNPLHPKNPLKRTLDALAGDHNAFTILVPPAHILLAHNDKVSNSRLLDICYLNEDFVQSHIIRSLSAASALAANSLRAVYHTLNNKQILLKNAAIFTGKGFRQSHKVCVTSFNHFHSFCDDFPIGSKFMVIYIDDCLSPNYNRRLLRTNRNPQQISLVDPLYTTPAAGETNGRLGKLISHVNGDSRPKNDLNPNINESITFVKLLRDFPILSNAVSAKFYDLFHHNNREYSMLRHSTRKRLDIVHREFTRMVHTAYQYVLDSVQNISPAGEQAHALLTSILQQYPGLDINRLVFEYVELNMYDAVWAQVTLQFSCSDSNNLEDDPAALRVLTTQAYQDLACLLLNHLDVPISKPWLVNRVYVNIRHAIAALSRLEDPSIVSSQEKTRIVSRTLSLLTLDAEYSVDADTLMGLLIMVVVHAKVKDFDAHLHYIKNYNSVDYTRNGALNYTLSNLEAVLCHLSPKDTHLGDLIAASNAARDLWRAIGTADVEAVAKFVHITYSRFGDDVPHHHSLYAKDIDGQDCIMLAVRGGSFEVYSLLVHLHAAWFTIDDLLFSVNASTGQTLLMISLQEGHLDIARDLVDVILGSATLEEQKAYFAVTDSSGRHIGHYLFHDLLLIGLIGPLVDWETKDVKSHTPLMCICRCYDHPQYDQLLTQAFDCVTSLNQEDQSLFWYRDHIDSQGNTILHFVGRGLAQTGLLYRYNTVIDVNFANLKNVSPMATYIKYRRYDNVLALIKDERLHLMEEDRGNGCTIFDLIAHQGSRTVAGGDAALRKIDQAIFDHFVQLYLPQSLTPAVVALHAERNAYTNTWLVQFRRGSRIVYKPLDEIKQLIHLGKLEFPFLLLPDPDQFWRNFGLGQGAFTCFHRFRINRLLEGLTMMLVQVTMQTVIPNEEYQSRFLQLLGENAPQKLMLDTVSGVTMAHDRDRRRASREYRVTNQSITEIETFLLFWEEKLQQSLQATHRFVKQLLVLEYKRADVKTVYYQLMKACVGYEDKSIKLEDTIELYTPGYLSTYVLEMELSIAGLLRSTQRLSNKLKQWKRVFMVVETLNAEARTLAEDLTSSLSVTSGDVAIDKVLLFADPLAPLDPELANTLGDDDENSTSFFTFGLYENPQARMHRVLTSRQQQLANLARMGGDVRYEHEQLALAFSSHIQERRQLFGHGGRMHVRNELRRLRQQLSELLRMKSSVQFLMRG